MPDYKDRFGDTDLDWLIFEDEEEPVKEKAVEKGRFIQDPTTGLLMGSEPGPDEGGGGGESSGGEAFTSMGGKTGGEKVKGVSDFVKDDVGVYYNVTSSPDNQKVFVDTWNKYVDKTPAEFKNEFLGGGVVKGKMSVGLGTYQQDAIEVKTKLQSDEGDDLGIMNATIFPEENRVHMDYYQLEDSMQSHGVMKSVMAHEMGMWEEMGVTRVDLLANLEVGGYAWARYGFEPEKGAWRELSNDLRNDIERLSEGGSSGEASSWEELGSDQQDDIESSFYDYTRDEFNDSEVESWRESGEPLERTKHEMAAEFNAGYDKEWASGVVQSYIKDRGDAGEPVPFKADSIIEAMELSYNSRYDDGKGDVGITFDPAKLVPVMEGITMTEKMEGDLTRLLEKQFDTEAEKRADNMDPPNHISDSARDSQRDHWDQMDDRDRYSWAEGNRPDLLKGGESEGTGEIPQEDADALLKLTNSSDPRAVWAIADSAWGKRLLVGKDWNGFLNTDNSDHMSRFNAYVAKVKK